MQELVAFFTEFARDPTALGAIAPSGKVLAAKTVEAAGIEPGHVVVELGAGSGPMTAELVARHPDAPLLVLEPNGRLAARLRERFPGATVEERLAQDLPELLEAWGHPRADRVVSSLPWAIWPPLAQRACFDAIVASLRPTGRLVTFAYLHALKLPAARRLRTAMDEHFTSVSRTRVAWRNLPPAFVYVCDGPRAIAAPAGTGR